MRFKSELKARQLSYLGLQFLFFALIILASVSAEKFFLPVSAGENGASKKKAGKMHMLWTWQSGSEAPLCMLKDKKGRDFLYLALRRAGLQMLKINGREAPGTGAQLGLASLGGLEASALAQNGDILYLALGNSFHAQGDRCGLASIDISDPEKPKLLSLWQSQENTFGASCLLIDGSTLYLGAMARGVFVFDITNPGAPKLVSSFKPDPNFPFNKPGRTKHPNVRDMALRDKLLYVCYDSGGIRILDTSDRVNIKELGRYLNGGMKQQQAYNGIVLDYPYAYCSIDYAGLEILDISDALNPKQIHWHDPWKVASGRNFWFGSGGHANQLAFDSQRKELYVAAGDSELLVYDLRNASQPRLLRQFGGLKDQMGTWGLCLDNDLVYLAYIKTMMPFVCKWNGVAALAR